MNETIYLTIALIAFAAVQIADVLSTRANNDNPNIRETNSRYRLPNGRANVKKLIIEKSLFVAVVIGISIVFAIYGARLWIALLPFISFLITLPVALKNYRLYRKYNKK